MTANPIEPATDAVTRTAQDLPPEVRAGKTYEDNKMIHNKNSRLVLPVLVLALTVPGLAILVGSQKTQTITAAETVGTYSIDPWHTNIGFRVRHMGLAIVLGEFTDYTGTISYFPNDITKSSVQFTAKVASLDTGVKQRDDHLRSADFFEVEKYPDITFRSTRLERKSEKTFIAYGTSPSRT